VAAMRWHGAKGEAVIGGYKDFTSVEVDVREKWAKDAHGQQPTLDLEDHGLHYRLMAEVPGIDVSELRVVIEPDYLVLEGRWGSSESVQPNGDPLISESKTGRFLRVIELPDQTAGQTAHAVLENGVLVIILPKKDTF
jgi:HSP20 family molecular chaperone IbpA